jgi:succinyl-diaminopimelate desuccinylase
MLASAKPHREKEDGSKSPMSGTQPILALLDALVRAPSRAGSDSYERVAHIAESWLRERRVECRRLSTGSDVVGLVAVVAGARKGPTYMINATLDTAGFGDEARWSSSPTSALVRDGWMYGRGTADSKAGAAIFCQLIADFAGSARSWGGNLVLLLDLDEHTGHFAGVRKYMDDPGLPRPDGVFIGYPGNDRLVVGSRGFGRAVVTVQGRAVHSGSSSDRGDNAVTRAAELAMALSTSPLFQRQPSPGFALPPRLTVTAMRGGEGFSMVPDRCELLVDVRLTPDFTDTDAESALRQVVAGLDRPGTPSTTVAWTKGWPAYRIADDHPLVSALRVSAEEEFERPIPPEIVGPSNIGNLLHTFGIPATCGFGVTYRRIHAVDECILLETLEPVYRAYGSALRRLFGAS